MRAESANSERREERCGGKNDFKRGKGTLTSCKHNHACHCRKSCIVRTVYSLPFLSSVPFLYSLLPCLSGASSRSHSTSNSSTVGMNVHILRACVDVFWQVDVSQAHVLPCCCPAPAVAQGPRRWATGRLSETRLTVVTIMVVLTAYRY